ncbi:MAG TPA: ABC transporter ATP-binding protein [Candidatus Aquicultor sp.]|jgi:ABC-type lipoprotein export system ATPase subunit
MLYNLEAVSLSYTLNKRLIPIISDLGITVQEGEFSVIMGPSGSGKTSILNIMAGFLRPTSGQVLFRDTDLYALSKGSIASYRNKEIGIVHQFFNLISSFNALQNIAAPLLIAGLKPNEAYERAEIVLERVGMIARAKHYPSELSGGEQQRIAIARALINQPKVILADEPTGNLDQRNTHEILDLFSDIHQKGTTIVMVTHDPMVAERATRAINMNKSFCVV